KGLIWEYVKRLGYEDIIGDYDETVPKVSKTPSDVVNIPTYDFTILSAQVEKEENERRLAKKGIFIKPEITTRQIIDDVIRVRKEAEAKAARAAKSASTNVAPTPTRGVSIPFNYGPIIVPMPKSGPA